MFRGAVGGARKLAGWLGVGIVVAHGAGAAELKLITLDPGHFHAALFQREMLPGISDEVFVYAPLGADLTAHLNRVAQFNLRSENPTHWRMRVYAGADFEEQLLGERAGQIVVMSGRNRGKINRILACARSGLHVLADKPWIIEPEDFVALETALRTAAEKRVILFDAMTQRFEISVMLQRALVNDPLLFGRPLTGSLAEPAVTIESLHHLFKEVNGVPSLRPAWFFDVAEQGEGLTDVGTHLVDQVAWVLFPEQPIAWDQEVQVLHGRRWPTSLTLAEYQRVTGEKGFPASLKPALAKGGLEYFCNNSVDYTLRGVHVRLQATWDFAAPPGRKDTERAIFRGSRARVEIRQGAAENYRPEVYVVPKSAEVRGAVLKVLRERLRALEWDWPGLAIEEQAERFRILIPEKFRVSHEAHFALVAQQFLDYVRNPKKLPAWEPANLLAKYYITTQGVALARKHPATP